MVERTGIEPAAAALQVQLAPLAHASPGRSRRGSNSPIAVDSRASSPEDFGTRWARLGRAPVLGVRRESNPRYEIHGLACDHHTAHTMWTCSVEDSNLRRSLIRRLHLPLC